MTLQALTELPRHDPGATPAALMGRAGPRACSSAWYSAGKKRPGRSAATFSSAGVGSASSP